MSLNSLRKPDLIYFRNELISWETVDCGQSLGTNNADKILFLVLENCEFSVVSGKEFEGFSLFTWTCYYYF